MNGLSLSSLLNKEVQETHRLFDLFVNFINREKQHAYSTSGSERVLSVVPGSSVIAPKRYLKKPNGCYMMESLKLPGHHHAYCTIRGPRNTLAMVSTPISLAAKIADFC